jgi:hypothetical protein
MLPLGSDITDAELDSFTDNGYLVLQLLDDGEIAALKDDIDELVAGAAKSKVLGAGMSPQTQERLGRLVRSPLLQQVPSERPRAYQRPHLGRLIWNARLMAVLDRIMATWRPRAEWTLAGGLPPVLDLPDDPERSSFVFHILNAERHDAGTEGLPWHHDYDQSPHTNRSHLMVHVLIYLNGLDGTIGDLLLAPGTQRSVASKRALWFMGWQPLPGRVVINDLPPGAAVIMHSAMFHARIPRGGGEGRPRYFINLSYCQGGVRWPGTYRDSHRTLRERHLAEGGQRPWLFDESRFFDPVAAHNLLEKAEGSLLGDGPLSLA